MASPKYDLVIYCFSLAAARVDGGFCPIQIFWTHVRGQDADIRDIGIRVSQGLP